MGNKTLTAVEWLLNNLHEIGVNHNLSIKAEKGWLEKRNEIIEQAKAMEKDNTKKLLEIIMWYDEESDVRPDPEIYNWFKQCYQETYGKTA